MDDVVDASALAALPIFPLPDAVLLPGALLPLHVFEPRYRAMTADVLAGRRLMGIARLAAGYEPHYEGRPAVHPIMGVGYVIGSEKRPDGRYDLLLRGVARVRIDAELPPAKLYREVRATLLVDHVADRGAIAARQARVLALCERLATVLDDRGDELRQLARTLPSPAACSDVLGAVLVREPDARQELLEETDPGERLEALAGHVAALLLEMTPRGNGAPN